MMPFALIDPNWGEPRIVDNTMQDSEEAVWEASVSPCGPPGLHLYSGASVYPLPDGTPGNVEALKKHGFTVRAVNITSTGWEVQDYD